MLIDLFYFGLGAILFCILYHINLQRDNGCLANLFDGVCIPFFLLIQSIYVKGISTNWTIQIFVMIGLIILLFNSYCDYKTQQVYNNQLGYILLGIATLGYKIFNQYKMAELEVKNIIIIVCTLFIFIGLIAFLLTGKIKFLKKKDGLCLIGNSLYLTALLDMKMFPIEYLLGHLLLAILLALLCSVTKFSFREMKWKESVAFLPYIYLAFLLMTYFLINIRK